MPTISLRITDEQKKKLEAMASQSGATQSAIVANALNRTLGIGGHDCPAYPAPNTLSNATRLILANQFRILKALETDDAEHYQTCEKILLDGSALEYYEVFCELEEELSYADCSEVLDILQMFQVLKVSYEELDEEERKDLHQNRIVFQGFDYSGQLESRMAHYAEYLLEKERFQWLKYDLEEYSDGGNSHSPRLAMYRRMLHCYKSILRRKDLAIAGSLILTHNEIEEIEKAAANNSGW